MTLFPPTETTDRPQLTREMVVGMIQELRRLECKLMLLLVAEEDLPKVEAELVRIALEAGIEVPDEVQRAAEALGVAP